MKAKQTPTKKQSAARVKVVKPISVRAKIKHHTKKLLIPHKHNQYRPHLIRARGLAAILIIAVLAQVTYSFTTTGRVSVLSRVASINTVELLAGTNQQRQAQNLPALALNDKLSQAAFLKAQDMFKNNYWAHTSPSGVEPWKWLGDVGYNYSYAGENLAKNYPTADATVTAWMNSEEHRANILNTHYIDVGFAAVDGILNGQNTTLVVALYGAPVTVVATQAVVGSSTPSNFLAPTVATVAANPLAYFGSALEALSPVTIAILGLLAIVAIVGAAAHHYRQQLPKAWKKSWRIHHGMYTFFGMILLGVLIIVATGSGQI